MATVKVSLSIGSASIQIEGDAESVKAEIERFYKKSAELGLNNAAATATPDRASADAGQSVPQKTRKSSTGPSCASRIESLRFDGFFDEPKTPKDIAEELRRNATPYQPNLIAASLTQLTKRKALRRIKTAGAWQYVNP